MFKGEYQGGPSVEVFSAQGRDSLSKKCKITGTSANIHKQYDKDVKSYVYILEGEPTTTKIQFPKEDKQGLFLTQKFLVFQLYLPVGRPFSFEVAVSDHALNKRRIFFSSNLKDISVTPLHAKFPLTALNLGSWLNLCLDLESLVNETFSGPKFRAVESFTVTANCRLKKVFTLRAPPLDTSEDQSHVVLYANSEPLPKNLQLMTTSEVSTITQILSYGKLHSKTIENSNTPISITSGHEGSTARHDHETHIAFGTKVVIPPHVRRNSLKENRENTSGKIPYNSRLTSSKSKHAQSSPDVRYTLDDSPKSPLTLKDNHDIKIGSSETAPEGVDVNQATIQPRPPRTSSAGKIRRPIRLKSSSSHKVKTNAKTDDAKDKQPNSYETETILISNGLKPQGDVSPEKSQNLDVSKNVRASQSGIEQSIVNHKLNNRLKTTEISADESDQNFTSSTQRLEEKNTMEYELKNGRVNKSLNLNQNRIDENIDTNVDVLNLEMSSKSSYNVNLRSSGNVTNHSVGSNGLIDEQKDISQIPQPVVNSDLSESETTKKINQMQRNDTSNDNPYHTSKDTEVYNANGVVNKSVTKESFDIMTAQNNTKNIDMNNNNPSMDNDIDKPRTKPRMLPLASNNPVFTFASMPRSPRSGKKKLFGSSMVDDDITPSQEATPEVMVSLAEDAIMKDPPSKNGVPSQRHRGASLEDDFCKLSDDECEEDGDGIQKLLQSSLSPRHSPMPFHHHLRQSIRSSMLKEIPSPVKENGYDAQNYQSDDHLATLNQSTASSWRFDTSDSSNSFNQTQDLTDSLNRSSFPKPSRHITAIADVPVLDDNEEDGHSDCSDDTTYSTWRAPPQDLRGNKYQNEMKPPVREPDLTKTISMDPRNYCDVYSPPIVLGTPNKDSNSAIQLSSPLQSPLNQNFPGANQQEEEEELDLLYDPCLNCYFDPKTHKYYELA